MKKRFPSFLAGAAAALALTALATSALAASGQVQFNFAGVALDGEMKITAGSDITAPNGQQVPGSILYVDEAGGKTNYLPIRTISELLGGGGGLRLRLPHRAAGRADCAVRRICGLLLAQGDR